MKELFKNKVTHIMELQVYIIYLKSGSGMII